MSNELIVIVVAGGQSRRMQPLGDKLFLSRGPADCTILCHVIQTVAQVAPTVWISYSSETNKQALIKELPQDIPLQWVPDKTVHKGPLAAVAGVLSLANPSLSAAPFLLVAGDLPGLTPSVLRRCIAHLDESSADVVAVRREHRIQPLLACYRAHCAKQFIDAAEAGESRLMRVLDQLQVESLVVADDSDDDAQWSVRPVHTPDDYDAWLTWRDTHEES